MSLKSFIDDELTRRNIERVGQCNQCGKCCAKIQIYQLWYYDTYNTIKLMEFKDETCESFDEPEGRCLNYEQRDEWCQLYPYLPENVLDGCGFSFISLDKK